ncbi:MAG TPA: hypothetical protein VMB34_11375 [Acetobacteraceae bacterium]|nr:hypothetical protein [Acetobacteraceae bacterium]
MYRPRRFPHLLHDLEASLGFALFSGRGLGAVLSESGARLARLLDGDRPVVGTTLRTCPTSPRC